MQPLTASAAGRHVLTSRRALAGFFLCGLILSFPGAILPAWGYHIRPHYVFIGNCFLSVVAGVLLSVLAGKLAQRDWSLRNRMLVGCGVSFASFIYLSFTGPPIPEGWRLPGLVGLGLGAGTLNAAMFQAISAAYRFNPAATVNLAGIFFGLGSLVSPLLTAGTFEIYSVSSTLSLLALFPAALALSYAKGNFDSAGGQEERPLRQVMRASALPHSILLSLVLFFHFGNEWAISGWLPLFLILRLGMSPVSALIVLAGYWLALMAGRVLVQAVLSLVSHGKLLLGGVLASLFGCLILAFTNNQFGAWSGTLLIGFGFAPVYPLMVEKIGDGFPGYHLGLFNGLFSVALTGAMLAPALLGYAAEFYDVSVVTVLPAVGTFLVLVLVVATWVTAKLAAWNSGKAMPPGGI